MTRTSALALLLSCTAFIACSAADQSPLGGPYGGVAAQPVAPGAASTSLSDGGSGDSGATGGQDGSSSAATGACTPAAAPATTPSFTTIYKAYFAPGAPVDCATGSGCHTQFQSASGAWSFLLQYGQVGTSPPDLTNPNISWLIWYGGSMPQTGAPCNPQAMADLNAWATAGGKDD